MTLSPFLIPNFFKPFAALETSLCNCLYEIFLVSLGSSPTQIIAVLSFLSLRWRSIQLAEAFKVPSSYHLILTSFLLYLTSLIFLYGLIQDILFPSFFQNSLLFLIESEYFFWYLALFIKALFTHSGLVLKINSLSSIFLEILFLICFTFFLAADCLRIFFLTFDLIFFFFKHEISKQYSSYLKFSSF